MRRLRGKGELVEVLTRAIANEYRDRALLLPSNGLQDIGERRKLREELQTRCNLTELQAVNIINGFHIPDYVRIAEVRAASLHTAGNVGIWQAAIFFTHRTADSNRLPGSATRLLFTTDTKGGRRYGNCRVLRTWQ